MSRGFHKMSDNKALPQLYGWSFVFGFLHCTGVLTVSKTLSVQTKTQSLHFQIFTPKVAFSRRISVDRWASRKYNLVFPCFSDSV